MKEPFKGSSKKNRTEEISLPRSEKFSITLYDVDLIIMEYMRDVVLMNLMRMELKLKYQSYMVIQKDGNLLKKTVFKRCSRKITVTTSNVQRNSLEEDGI